MLWSTLAWMIWPNAGVAEEIELRIRLYETADFRPRFRRRQPKCKLAHDAMASIPQAQALLVVVARAKSTANK